MKRLGLERQIAVENVRAENAEIDRRKKLAEEGGVD